MYKFLYIYLQFITAFFTQLNEDRKGGYIRFHSVELAEAALKEHEAKEADAKTVAGIKGSLRKAEAEEEAEYYKRVGGARGQGGERVHSRGVRWWGLLRGGSRHFSWEARHEGACSGDSSCEGGLDLES